MRPALLMIVVFQSLHTYLPAAEFETDWKNQNDRVWIGPQFWANPMEDWRLSSGRVECMNSKPGRNLHLLTHQLLESGSFEASVTIGLQSGSQGSGMAGFELGIQSELGDYRSSLLRGNGLQIVVDSQGRLGTADGKPQGDGSPQAVEALNSHGLHLSVRVEPSGVIAVVAKDAKTGAVIDTLTLKSKGLASGNIALSHNPKAGKATFWFQDWRVSGDRVTESSDQQFGPILYPMYTLSRGVLKMNVQMPPLGEDDDRVVELQVPIQYAQKLLDVPGVESTQVGDSKWAPIARSTIDPYACTALFRIPHWIDTQDVPYRLVYRMQHRDGSVTEHDFLGTVRKDPIDKNEISVAGFTGNQDTAFPNTLLVSNVKKHDPDVLFFSGDQIYEGVGGFGIYREPVDLAVLNYLRKIYLWGWAFRDVLKDRPSIVLPDDHDVYQGNIWGENGKPVPGGVKDHSQGGFVMHPDFVNAVFRTQTAHHPDFYDPTPMLQGIDVFYGDMIYGRISFAVLEDRYFKSGPEGKVNDWPGRPDHCRDENYDTSKLDKPGLTLLGQRQLDFLDDWAANWTGSDFKCVLSQTIFCNLANYHGGNQEFIFADLDSNGWPQTGRNRAVDAMRKGFAFHYAGDQHLASIVHHGVDAWNDANWSFCVPSTAAGYPRSWRPDTEGRPVQNRPEPSLPNTGEYQDAFGNHMTVYAIGNPAAKNRKPVLELLHDKASGYGIVRFNKQTQEITMECWKLLFDAAHPKADDQFLGWPKTIKLADNYGRPAAASLPKFQSDIANPVIQVRDNDGNIVYTRRFLTQKEYELKVFSPGMYNVTVSNPDKGISWTIELEAK